MRKRYFDFFGVRSSEDGRVVGYIAAPELKRGLCQQYLNKFDLADLISDSTPLINVLPILRSKQRVFVLSENNISGIITRADLQKPPVRILLFGLVSLLEIHLSYLIQKHYLNDDWKKKLNQKRIAAAEELMQERMERNENLDLIDCLQLCDKRDLVMSHPEIYCILHLASKKSGKKLLNSIRTMRDKLAHSQDIVAGSTWEEIIDLAGKIEQLIQRSEEHSDTQRALGNETGINVEF